MRAFLFGMVVALVLIIGVALYFNWMDVSVARTPSGNPSAVTVGLHPDKAKDDLNKAGARVGETARDVRDEVREGVGRLKTQHTTKGTLQSVDAAASTVTVKPENGSPMTVELTDNTKIQIGDKPATRDDLKPGQTVRCTHTDQGGKHVCQSLTIELTK